MNNHHGILSLLLIIIGGIAQPATCSIGSAPIFADDADRELEELIRESEAGLKKFLERLAATANREAYEKLYAENPNAAYAAKFLTFADNYSGTPAAHRALLWVCRVRGGQGERIPTREGNVLAFKFHTGNLQRAIDTN